MSYLMLTVFSKIKNVSPNTDKGDTQITNENPGSTTVFIPHPTAAPTTGNIDWSTAVIFALPSLLLFQSMVYIKEIFVHLRC